MKVVSLMDNIINGQGRLKITLPNENTSIHDVEEGENTYSKAVQLTKEEEDYYYYYYYKNMYDNF